MNRLDHVLQLTEDLIQLTSSSSEKERDEQMKQLESLLHEREQALKNIVPPYTNEEKEKGRKLLALEEQLKKQLEIIRSHIKKDIVQLKATKHSAQKYVNPYQQQTIDGMFYDKRK